jgi:hypothetical protein
MLFARVGGSHDEVLCIFGTLQSRRAAQLKIISVIENKQQGHFVDMSNQDNPIRLDYVRGDDPPRQGWGLETQVSAF